jgi:myo-inositol 2-dehydrogenase/D-chiro-inositol 1-dehydrogenase
MPIEARTLNVALIGQGFMGRAHSNAYHQAGHFFELPYILKRKVICGQDADRLQQIADQWEWEETSTDWRAVVQRADIDVVDIATPNSLHAPMAIAAAEAGKIVFCEKPLSLTLEEAERMASAARGRPTMVWFNYRRVPAIAFARELIRRGDIGEIYHYRATYLQEWGPVRRTGWKLDPNIAGSGVIGDLLSHLVDTAMFLNGPLTEVTSFAHTFADGRAIEDAVAVLCRFANGSIGTFEATRYATGCRNRNAFEIHGSKGMLAFNLEDLNRLQFFNAADPSDVRGARDLMITGMDHPYTANFWKPGHIIGYEHTFIAALADFLKALAGGAEFHPDFGDAVEVHRVLDAVTRSAASRRWEPVTPGRRMQ